MKASLHQCLLNEQGWICAYTMKRIDDANSHIEHIKPETLCRADQKGSDLDYDNLVTCFPLWGMDRKYRYGAQQKGDWWKNDGREFVSPLHPNCETRFRFDLEGNIAAVNGHKSAQKTIQVLGLDHGTLTEERRRVIEEFVYGETRDNPLSQTQASRAIGTICERDGAGCFHEFCMAIRDALVEHMKVLRKLARKRKFAGKR
jgi:uncharacterized protein (TIGR02646 family)